MLELRWLNKVRTFNRLPESPGMNRSKERRVARYKFPFGAQRQKDKELRIELGLGTGK